MEECPKCLGAEKIMTPKEKGFEYKVCDLCKGYGAISPVLAEDFISSEKIYDEDE